MSSIPAFQSGIHGIQSGLQRLNKDAARIASAPNQAAPDNLITPMVDMTAAKQQVQAAAKVIETSSAMLGSILDIKV